MSIFFSNTLTLEELKKEYRRLSMIHHPDLGGDAEKMKLLNAEYDTLYNKIYKIKATSKKYESSTTSRQSWYEERGWKGENYNISLHTTDITKLVRDYVKKHYPYCKFSITTRHCSSITIGLMSAPFSPFEKEEHVKDFIQEDIFRTGHTSFYNVLKAQATQLNHFYIANDWRLTKIARAILGDVIHFLQSYNYDHSDSMTDYFDTNFYVNLEIGRWDRAFVIKGKITALQEKEINQDVAEIEAEKTKQMKVV